jgi:hypothetical protein
MSSFSRWVKTEKNIMKSAPAPCKDRMNFEMLTETLPEHVLREQSRR